MTPVMLVIVVEPGKPTGPDRPEAYVSIDVVEMVALAMAWVMDGVRRRMIEPDGWRR